jgi:hypothetical protein
VGQSAYQIWLAAGNVGTTTTFLNSLIGPSAYAIWLQSGNAGTQAQFLASLIGPPGSQGPSGYSAYTIAVQNGFVGTQAQWLQSLVGPPGTSAWSSLTGVPSTFPPSPHTHAESDVVGLVTDLNNRVLKSTQISTAGSVTGGGNLSGNLTITLVNDAANPGPRTFYGTDATSTKGYLSYGTAALLKAPATGNASSVQVATGTDSRLSDSGMPLTHGLLTTGCSGQIRSR